MIDIDLNLLNVFAVYDIMIYITSEEGDRADENFGCVIIILIKFVDQHIIEFSSCCIYIKVTLTSARCDTVFHIRR